jgi:hypothetical protein
MLIDEDLETLGETGIGADCVILVGEIEAWLYDIWATIFWGFTNTILLASLINELSFLTAVFDLY